MLAIEKMANGTVILPYGERIDLWTGGT